MYAEISAAIGSAKTALELLKSATGLANHNELVAAVSEVNTKLMDATAVALASQEKQFALVEEINTLKRALEQADGWKSQSAGYVLQSVGVEGKHFAQVYKPAPPDGKAKHWACAKCFQEQKLYILNATEKYTYRCPSCKTEIGPIAVGGALASIESAY